MRRLALLITFALSLAAAAPSLANTSHDGWPVIDGSLVMHKDDQSGPVVGAVPSRHNELLGGHGSDVIVAGDAGDVLWGDYKPGTQPTTQVDHLTGGAGNDFIYASHGRNIIFTGGGADVVHAHYGRGEIHCGTPQTIVYLSHRSRKHYRLFGCHRISYKTVGH